MSTRPDQQGIDHSARQEGNQLSAQVLTAASAYFSTPVSVSVAV